MAYTHEKRLERFLRQQLWGEHDEKLVALLIKHAPQGHRGTVVFERKMADPVEGDEGLFRLRDEIFGYIEDDAAGLGGVQRYIVEAMREGLEKPSGRFACNVQADLVDGEEGFDSEPPTSQGLIAQQMRHNEVLMKTFAQSVGMTVGTMQRMLAQTAEHNERLINQRFQSIDTLESAMSQQHARDMELLEKTSSIERRDAAFQKLMTLAPSIVDKASKKLLGTSLIPDAKSPTEVMVGDLVKSIDREQLANLARVLRQDQQILLVSLLQAVKAEEEKENVSQPKNGQS